MKKKINQYLSSTALEDESVQDFLNALQEDLVLKENQTDALRSQINERKRIEKELNRTVNLLVTLLTNLQSGILAEDENRRVLFANDLFCSTFGMADNAESLKGRDCGLLSELGKEAFKHP